MTIRKFRAELRQGSIDVGMIQDQGARDYQEDTAGFTELPRGERPEVFGAVVADGMGGMSAGALVSSQAVAGILASQIKTPQELAASVRKVSREIAAEGSHGGTTLAAVYCLPGGVHFCSVGDSRVYRLHDGVLTQLTADQDYMSLLLERVIDGRISCAQAEQDPERDSLAQFVGSGANLSPDMNCMPLRMEPGDRLLICSDGVYNALNAKELMQSLTLTAGGAAEDILGRVLSRGYSNQDNFTAVVLEFLPGWEDFQCSEAPDRASGGAVHLDSAFHSGTGGASENQDSLFCGGGVYAAADGLGGHRNGAKASAAAVKYLSEHTGGEFTPEEVNELFEGANEAVRSSGGLSAAAAGFLHDGVFTCGNVGDCRVYYFRDGKIMYQSRDHSVCQAEVELGEISREEIRSSDDRSGLLKALGGPGKLGLRERCEPVSVRPGDAFLVCTDGFWQHVHEHEMEADLIKAASAAGWLSAMLKRHLLSSHDLGDNYTAVCGIFRPVESPKPEKRRPVHLPMIIGAGAAFIALAGLAAALIYLMK